MSAAGHGSAFEASAAQNSSPSSTPLSARPPSASSWSQHNGVQQQQQQLHQPPHSSLLPPSPGYTETLQSPVNSDFADSEPPTADVRRRSGGSTNGREAGASSNESAGAGPGPSSMQHGRHSLAHGQGQVAGNASEEDDEEEEEQEDVCAFTLLAEFDIDAGATMAYQYPHPTGTDEHRLAELMLPDGVHMRTDDSTFFYLGQHPSTSIASLLSTEPSIVQSPSRHSIEAEDEAGVDPRSRGSQGGGAVPKEKPTPGSPGAPLLYVMNCVRCQMNKEVKRGAEVKAMAIASPVPWLEVWRPILVWYLGEYFKTPDYKILQDLYELCNSLIMPAVPRFTRTEKIILRQEDRLDALAEVYDARQDAQMRGLRRKRMMSATGSHSRGPSLSKQPSASSLAVPQGSWVDGRSTDTLAPQPPSSASSTKGAWKTPEPDEPERFASDKASYPSAAAASISSRRIGSGSFGSALMETSASGTEQEVYNGIRLVVSKGNPARDTRFVEMRKRIDRLGETPFRVPTNAFDEDVGGYSLVKFVNMLKDHTPFPAPYYPHLHTSGSSTPPVILIINALLANHRVIFFSASGAAPACQAVLSACALASGCGQVIRGITDVAFPYANLSMVEIMEELPGFVVGVNNPRFEELPMLWDVYVDVEKGSVKVNRNVQAPSARAPESNRPAPSIRSGRSSETSHSGSLTAAPLEGQQSAKINIAKGEGYDNLFMDEILTGLDNHLGENYLRRRFTDWLRRFVSLAAHHEYTTTGLTKIGFPSVSFKSGGGVLGSGAVFADEAAKQREMQLNVPRIEAWRRTKGYRLFAKDWARETKTRLLPFDAAHQFGRLRVAKNMSDEEIDAIYRTLAKYTDTYEHVVELLAAAPSKKGGLQVIANGLFHRYPGIRESAVDILLNLQSFEIGRQMIAGLSYYHRTAFMRALSQRQ